MFFFFNDTATTEIYTLSLHDALPISGAVAGPQGIGQHPSQGQGRRQPRSDDARHEGHVRRDRKSTRLNSSHANISYAVFCLKKKKNIDTTCITQHLSTVLSIFHLNIC